MRKFAPFLFVLTWLAQSLVAAPSPRATTNALIDKATHYTNWLPQVMRRPQYAAGFNIGSLTWIVRLEADAITGKSDGDAITTWSDTSGASNSPTQGTSGQRPLYKTNIINSLPALLFDGTDDQLVSSTFSGGTATQPNTIYVLGKVSSTGTQYFLIDGIVGTSRNAIFNENTANWQFYSGSVINFGASNTSFHIFVATFDGASSKLRIDGGAGVGGNAGAHTLTGITVGAQSNGLSSMSGYIAVALVANSSHSLTNINNVGSTLATKYGLTWTTAT